MNIFKEVDTILLLTFYYILSYLNTIFQVNHHNVRYSLSTWAIHKNNMTAQHEAILQRNEENMQKKKKSWRKSSDICKTRRRKIL